MVIENKKFGLLNLTIEDNEWLKIGDDVFIKVVKEPGVRKFRFAIKAPKEIKILRMKGEF